MPLDFFAIADGLDTYQDARRRGLNDLAERTLSDMERGLRMMASAQGIKFAAEKHPLEMTGMGLQNKAVEAGTKATEQATEQKGIIFGQEQEERKQYRQGFNEQFPDMSPDMVRGQQEAIKTQMDLDLMAELSTAGYPSLQAKNMIDMLDANLKIALATVKKLEREAQDAGNASLATLYKIQRDQLEDQVYVNLGYKGGKAEFNAVSNVQGEKRSQEKHELEMSEPQRQIEADSDKWARYTMETLSSGAIGDPQKKAIALAIATNEKDKESIRNMKSGDGFSQEIADWLKSKFTTYMALAPTSLKVKADYDSFMNVYNVRTTPPASGNTYIPDRKVKIAPPQQQATQQKTVIQGKPQNSAKAMEMIDSLKAKGITNINKLPPDIIAEMRRQGIYDEVQRGISGK